MTNLIYKNVVNSGAINDREIIIPGEVMLEAEARAVMSKITRAHYDVRNCIGEDYLDKYFYNFDVMHCLKILGGLNIKQVSRKDVFSAVRCKALDIITAYYEMVVEGRDHYVIDVKRKSAPEVRAGDVDKYIKVLEWALTTI